MSVNVENMRKWVARLRDPEAKQATGALHDWGEGMCCLGHACDVSGLTEWVNNGGVSLPSYFGVTGTLPVQVKRWLGLTSSNPPVAGKSISLWNDQDGATLTEIADLIEAEWPEVKS